MLAVIPFFSGDVDLAIQSVRWQLRLGAARNHDCLLIHDPSISSARAGALHKVVREVYRHVQIAAMPHSIRGWPDAANAMFAFAAATVRQPFLWLEPDAIPLRSGWLDQIEQAYVNTPFLGCIYGCEQQHLPRRLMAGVAVYPADTHARMPIHPEVPMAWDVFYADQMVENGRHTPLIQHFWGQPDLPPVFSDRIEPHMPINTFTLERLNPQSVLFHRNKDGSLIRCLTDKLFPEDKKQLTVVFHVAPHDIDMAIHHARWLNSLGSWPNTALISCDPSLVRTKTNSFKSLLKASFANVETFIYPKPPRLGWPFAPNWAWQRTARHMANQEKPWFWFEADAVVLSRDWLAQLQSEYIMARKSFMGPVVKGMSHSNGVMIYPAQAAQRMPKAMAATSMAWDYVGSHDILHDLHDASHLMQHIWTMTDSAALETDGGRVPMLVTEEWARSCIRPTAVMLHRVKDSSLVNVLCNRQKQK